MKKTIASLALLVSAGSAFALVGPGPNPPQPKNVCLSVYEGNQGESYLGDCDLTPNNKKHNVKLLANGCAQGQASLKSFRIQVPACVPIAQL
jgi:hypothetical protein